MVSLAGIRVVSNKIIYLHSPPFSPIHTHTHTHTGCPKIRTILPGEQGVLIHTLFLTMCNANATINWGSKIKKYRGYKKLQKIKT